MRWVPKARQPEQEEKDAVPPLTGAQVSSPLCPGREGEGRGASVVAGEVGGVFVGRAGRGGGACQQEQDDVARNNPFQAVHLPKIKLHEYLLRVAKYSKFSDVCLVVGLVYIERLLKREAIPSICPKSAHRLLFTSVIVAAKFMDDVSYKDSYYARVSGLGLAQVTALQLDFLKLIDWDLAVSPEEYERYRTRLSSPP